MNEPTKSVLTGYKIVSLALNVPGPVAVKRMLQFGAEITKVEPPAGDPLKHICPAWYADLTRNQSVLSLDLKQSNDRRKLENLLENADLLLTSMRPSALKRSSLDFKSVFHRHLDLCQIAVIGYPTPFENAAGHDLNYQADAGLVEPPRLPNTLLSDLAGAERIVAEAFRLFLARKAGDKCLFATVSLSETAADFAAPLVYGLTARNGFLSGGSPEYNLYKTKDGWVALAALEAHFLLKLKQLLDIEDINIESLRRIFSTKTSDEWIRTATAYDLPLTVVNQDFEQQNAEAQNGY